MEPVTDAVYRELHLWFHMLWCCQNLPCLHASVYRKWPTLLSWYLATVVTWDYNGPQHTLDPQISFCCHVFTLLLCFGTVWILVWGVRWGQSVFFSFGRSETCVYNQWCARHVFIHVLFIAFLKHFFFFSYRVSAKLPPTWIWRGGQSAADSSPSLQCLTDRPILSGF